jgi:hypothetical protein
MKNICIVLGAGFSKAVANLPVTKEMITAFKKEIEIQRSLNNTNRVKHGERLLEFLNKLETDFLKVPYSKADKGGIILESNYLENFEGLCSFIDLNLAFEIKARCENNGLKAGLFGKPLFVNYTTGELKQIKGYIGNYLYLTLINDKSNIPLLDKMNIDLFPNCQSIITFNYDLIIEKYLFNTNYWVPLDGYGFTPNEFPLVNKSYINQSSKIKIYKMHGSLNWLPSSIYKSNLEFNWFDDNNNYFFPGYLKEEKKRGFRYQGAYSAEGWILPSWIKHFTFKEIVQVWSQANQALNNADEIIFIGYSLPKADSAVYSLFSSINWDDKKILLIDPNAEELIKDYSFIIRNQNIDIAPVSLENYFDTNI